MLVSRQKGPNATRESIANVQQTEMSENKAGLRQLPQTATPTADALLRVGRGEHKKRKSTLLRLLLLAGDDTDRT